MLRRLEREASSLAREPVGQELSVRDASQVVAPVLDLDFDASLLPRDHPQWAKDVVTLSTRAREVLARLKPVLVRILTFWDHRIRNACIGSARVTIDPTGSYRIE